MEITGTIAMSRMMALQQQMEVVGNNIANVNTTGFKAIELLLKSENITPSAPGVLAQDRRPIAMTTDWGTIRNTSQGAIAKTGNPLDIAIQGKGYFTVTDGNGEQRYTRNGTFQMNASGQLVDMSGNKVQGSGGEITIPAGATTVTISSDGTVSTNKGTAGKLQLVTFDNEQALQPDGNNALKAVEGAEAKPTTVSVVQGALESSNVNGVLQMTRMIEIQRRYQSAANIVEQEHSRQRSALQSLAKIS